MNAEMLAGYEGFGESTMQELMELRKALSIGYTQPVTGQGFDALRVESLESTLKLLTYQATHIRLWNAIPKQDAFSTVEEYNRLLQYGPDAGGFVASGVLPEEEDTTYERADQKVKYLGTTRSVHHPATLVRTVPPDLIGRESMNGALWLMGKLNSGLYYADADKVALEFNGLSQQIEGLGYGAGAPFGHVIDLRGAALTQEAIENAAQLIVDNFGLGTRLFSNPKVFTDFAKLFYGAARFPQPIAPENTAGTPVTGFQTLAGRIGFEPDTFVKRGSTAPVAATSPKAPATPTDVGVVIDATPDTGTSLFGAADAGQYGWTATAINEFGESTAFVIDAGAVATVPANQAADLTITDGAGANPTRAYKIYRTDKGGGIGSTIAFTGKVLKRTGATDVWEDLNGYLPKTFIGLLLDMSDQSLSFKQLSPMIKMDLAVIAPAIRWMQLLYGTPIMYAPKKNVLFRNIGVAA